MNNRADQLQFFRFCAFLLICAHHMGRCQLSWFPHGNGAANAVEFFIVLSGAVHLIKEKLNVHLVIYLSISKRK